MERKVNTIFIVANQNNSGGYYIQNDEVNKMVIVEGYDESHCQSRLKEYLQDNSDYCECCGERWYSRDIVDSKHEEYLKKLTDLKECENGNCIIHFLDKSVTVNSELYLWDLRISKE
ncbi:hypothetical protein [Macrococcoides caseolyticum]|uniref:DUF7296 family protein n=1 Tax=Macrococcoides caseolyticum TaxID=69966 RepID=UPI000C33E554|nr:hypothetical protein [Macrococcus caseolyticus]PKF14023.1 hypothetical protein CW690_08725 [Macrococcus caseolyticus]